MTEFISGEKESRSGNRHSAFIHLFLLLPHSSLSIYFFFGLFIYLFCWDTFYGHSQQRDADSRYCHFFRCLLFTHRHNNSVASCVIEKFGCDVGFSSSFGQSTPLKTEKKCINGKPSERNVNNSNLHTKKTAFFTFKMEMWRKSTLKYHK